MRHDSSKQKQHSHWGLTNDKKTGSEGVTSSHNSVWFYAGVNKPNVLELNKTLKMVTSKNLTLQHDLGLEERIPIKLHINSGGGLIVAGVSGMDAILRNSVPVHTVVDGFCASAATFMSVAGHKRSITENSFMLIHELSTNFWGKYKEFEDEKRNLDLMMDMIKSVYSRHTHVPSKELDGVLKHDLMWDSQKCLDLGLVDEIIHSVNVSTE